MTRTWAPKSSSTWRRKVSFQPTEELETSGRNKKSYSLGVGCAVTSVTSRNKNPKRRCDFKINENKRKRPPSASICAPLVLG